MHRRMGNGIRTVVVSITVPPRRPSDVCFASIQSQKTMRKMIVVLTVTMGLRICALAQFETRASTPTASQTFSTAVADFNRDGKSDIATANNDLQVFLGNG